jgi:ATP-dependent helicase Lhr and Lhr-like helicase
VLKQWGASFFEDLQQQSGPPTWRDLLCFIRRLEARGEIRGGRFVQGFAGEHFALPEAISLMRRVRKRADAEQLITISSADPLNLTGIITPGKRITSQIGHCILCRDGKPIASKQGGEVAFDDGVPESEYWRIKMLLTRNLQPANYDKSQQGSQV